MRNLLENYRQLTERVDALCSSINKTLGDQITCSPGCSSCCTSISIFPVEAAALREALNSLPMQQSKDILRHVSAHADDERCPLLLNNLCSLYEARPVICRTHGLPIVYTADGRRSSDCCPLNMTDIESVSGSSVVDVDKLNTLLVAVNSIYLTQTDSASDSEARISIAAALSQRQ